MFGWLRKIKENAAAARKEEEKARLNRMQDEKAKLKDYQAQAREAGATPDGKSNGKKNSKAA